MLANMSIAEDHISLAKKLPTRLQKFFALNPPRFDGSPSSINHLAASASVEAGSQPISTDLGVRRSHRFNPFQPHKNPKTGKWHPPIYSLRRQADLCKMAREYGVEDLLPYSKKKSTERDRIREEHGLRVKGTGVGQRVKGHAWERTLKTRLEKRRQAMLRMPRMIYKWKLSAHGRYWKYFPK